MVGVLDLVFGVIPVVVLVVLLLAVPALQYRAFRMKRHLEGARLAFVCYAVALELPLLGFLLVVLYGNGWVVFSGPITYLAVAAGSLLVALILVAVGRTFLWRAAQAHSGDIRDDAPR